MKIAGVLTFVILAVLVPVVVKGGQSPSSQSPYDFDHGRIAYTSAPTSDPITKIQARIDSGDLDLKFDADHGYLPALLDELRIPRTSQSLVFSKTSLQLFLIAPQNPRAIYFNDDVYIGSVQASPILEVASMDPKLGAIFYTLPQKKADKPQFQREFLACLLCHDTPVTNEVPGLMTLSVLTDREGNVIPAAGTSAMTDRTAFKERFGGWYVTGTHGTQQHWGNLTANVTKDTIGDAKTYVRRLNLQPGANVLDLKSRFNTEPYLTPNSDIVALMVLTHQTRLHNVITRTRFDVEAAGDDPERIRVAVEPLVRSMFFVWEAGLDAPVAGNTNFARDFEAVGPRDRKGRSLRDLDLNKRLFRYPMSYLVYSDQFAGLQEPARKQFFKRVAEILTSSDPGRDFSHLTEGDRTAIAEILTDTQPEFAALTKK
jgi:hypothetical protein